MEVTHLAGVLKVEQASFDDPWNSDAWSAELAYHDAICFVALGTDKIIKGMIALRKTLDESHIMRLAVLPGTRHKGIATSLLRTGLNVLRNTGCRHVYLELRQSNQAAFSFYKKHDFRIVGKRKAYYGRPMEDATVMCLTL
jgi:ribosomal-protein-alanine N-acetyltransferase